jgi:hypothetical protein
MRRVVLLFTAPWASARVCWDSSGVAWSLARTLVRARGAVAVVGFGGGGLATLQCVVWRHSRPGGLLSHGMGCVWGLAVGRGLAVGSGAGVACHCDAASLPSVPSLLSARVLRSGQDRLPSLPWRKMARANWWSCHPWPHRLHPRLDAMRTGPRTLHAAQRRIPHGGQCQRIVVVVRCRGWGWGQAVHQRVHPTLLLRGAARAWASAAAQPSCCSWPSVASSPSSSRQVRATGCKGARSTADTRATGKVQLWQCVACVAHHVACGAALPACRVRGRGPAPVCGMYAQLRAVVPVSRPLWRCPLCAIRRSAGLLAWAPRP